MKLLPQCTVLVLCAGFLSCGTPGAPRPPSLDLPRPPEDLAAARKGSKVTLVWTPSEENTDGTLVRRAGPTSVCRGLNDFPMTACVQAVGEVNTGARAPVKSPGGPPKAVFTDILPAQRQLQFPTGFATYAVEALNRRGRTAGLSNQVQVPLAPTLPPPAQVQPHVTAEGVDITAVLPEPVPTSPDLLFDYHVYRRLEGSTGAIDLGLPTLQVTPGETRLDFIDRTVEWEKTYFYHLAAVTTVTQNGKQIARVEGDDSPEIKVLVHDIFPPAQPVGVQAVYSGPGQQPFIDLTWASNQEPDLAGYNVYRRENGGEWTRINSELVKAPAFRDTDVEPGHTYFYSVTAVDLRGNEGPKSEPANETVPQ